MLREGAERAKSQTIIGDHNKGSNVSGGLRRETLDTLREELRSKDKQLKAKDAHHAEQLQAKDEHLKAKDAHHAEQLQAKDEHLKAKDAHHAEQLQAKDEHLKAKDEQINKLLDLLSK